MEKAESEKKSSLVSHEKVVRMTRPAYLFGLWGGVVTLAVSIFLVARLFTFPLPELDTSFFQMTMVSYFVVALLMLFSVYLLRKEHHSFGGSILLLCSSVVGLSIAAGLLIGPVLGLIGAILGLSEHEKLVKHHLD